MGGNATWLLLALDRAGEALFDAAIRAAWGRAARSAGGCSRALARWRVGDPAGSHDDVDAALPMLRELGTVTDQAEAAAAAIVVAAAGDLAGPPPPRRRRAPAGAALGPPAGTRRAHDGSTWRPASEAAQAAATPPSRCRATGGADGQLLLPAEITLVLRPLRDVL
ncbi:MAG: hypothetical protein R3F59_15200 [Myxococcota bacterium]